MIAPLPIAPSATSTPRISTRKIPARMSTIVKGLGIVVAVVLGSIAPAWADVCLRDSIGVLFVGKGFSLPGEGRCKPFNGYLAESLLMVTGGACGTSNTDEIYFTLTLGVGSLRNGSSAAIDLARSSKSGTVRYCTWEYECTNRPIAVIPCPASRPFGPE